MRYALLAIVLTFLCVCIPASASEFQDIKDEIISLRGATPENEAKLKEYFLHPDQGVQLTAKMRLAQMYWTSGQLEASDALLTDITSQSESYSFKYQVEVQLTWAQFEQRRNNFVEAERYARRAYEIANSSHSQLTPMALSVLATILIQQGKWVEARNNLELSLVGYEEADDAPGIFRALNGLGVLYRDLGNYAEAIPYLQRARVVIEEIDIPGERATLYYNLGDIYLASNEPQRALDYYQQALEIDLALNDLSNAAFDYRGITNAHLKLNQPVQALQSNQQAIQLILQIGAPQELSYSYLQQAAIYGRLEKHPNQLVSLNLARDVANESGIKVQKMRVDAAFGGYYLEQQLLDTALENFLNALQVAEELELAGTKQDLHAALSKVHQQLGDFETAFFHLDQSNRLKDELNSDDQRERTEKYKRDVNLLEEQLKVSELTQTQLEQEQELRAQREKQRMNSLIMIGMVLFFVAGMFVFWQYRRLNRLRVKLYEDALQEKQQLFADVSHELRTPLTALKMQITALESNLVKDVDSGYKKLSRKVSEINRLISDIYQLAQADSLSIELNVKKYPLSSIFNDWESDWRDSVTSAGFEWQCQMALGNATIEMDAERIKQVIDNLLSNSTFYTDKPGKIQLAAAYNKNQLVVSIDDTAPTVEESKLEKIFTRLYRVESSRSRQRGGSGLGLAICESLIKAHGGTIAASQSKLGGLKVEFRI